MKTILVTTLLLSLAFQGLAQEAPPMPGEDLETQETDSEISDEDVDLVETETETEAESEVETSGLESLVETITDLIPLL